MSTEFQYMVEVIITTMVIVVKLLYENNNGEYRMQLPDYELEVTDSAISRVLDVMQSENLIPKNTFLRIAIRGRVAGDYDYGLGLDERKDQIHHRFDNFFDIGEFDLVVDEKSLEKLTGSTIDYIEDLNHQGFKIDNPNKPVESEIEMKISDLLNTTVNPQIASHGGNIQVVSIDANVLYIEMSGGCQGCSASKYTLQHGVEQQIKSQFPEIKSIVDTTNHEAGENPYYE